MAPTVFLLGAGASRDAGFPLMDELTERFPEWLVEWGQGLSEEQQHRLNVEKLSTLYRESERMAGGQTKGAPNIEFVMRFLTDLHSFKNQYEDAVHGWAKPLGQVTSQEIEQLLDVLREYMKDELRLRERGGRGDYLDALFDFIPEDGSGLDVFTLNYDRLLEARCALREKRFTTGFGESWAPVLLESETWDLRIHKLHGSVDWYRLPRTGLVYRGEESHYAYPGEKPASAALYPAGTKAAYAEPFSTLRSNFIRALGKADRLIVIGYSFADEHVRRVVLDHLRINENLEVVIVDPRPQAILFMERPNNEEPIFSDFPDRVVGLWSTGRKALQDRQIRIREGEIATARNLRSEFLHHRARPDFSSASALLLQLADYLWETDMPGKAEPLPREVEGQRFRSQLEVRLLAEARVILKKFGQHFEGPHQPPAYRKPDDEMFPQLVLRWLLAHTLGLDPSFIGSGIDGLMKEWMAGLVILNGDMLLAWSVQNSRESRDATLPIKIWKDLTKQVELLEPRGLGFPWLGHVSAEIREKAMHLTEDLANLRAIYDLLRDSSTTTLFRIGGSHEAFVRTDADAKLAYLQEPSQRLIESGFLERWGQNPTYQAPIKRVRP